MQLSVKSDGDQCLFLTLVYVAYFIFAAAQKAFEPCYIAVFIHDRLGRLYYSSAVGEPSQHLCFMLGERSRRTEESYYSRNRFYTVEHFGGIFYIRKSISGEKQLQHFCPQSAPADYDPFTGGVSCDPYALQ